MKKLLLTVPRSGTTWLASLLRGACNATMEQKLYHKQAVWEIQPKELLVKIKESFAANPDILFYFHLFQRDYTLFLKDEFFKDAKIVVLYRHPFDSFISTMYYMKYISKNEWIQNLECKENMVRWIQNTNKTRMNYSEIIEQTVLPWKELNRALLIKYEDLWYNPKETLTKIINWFGYDKPNEEKLENTINSHSFKRMSSGREIGSTDNKSFFRCGLANGWKTYFSEKEIIYLNNSLLMKTAKKLGY